MREILCAWRPPDWGCERECPPNEPVPESLAFQINKHQQETARRTGENKATLSDSPNKGDLKGL